MSKLTKEEVAMWIRNLIPYLENPVKLAPVRFIKKDEEIAPGAIIPNSDTLCPSSSIQTLEQTENIKALVELYKVVSKDGE